MVFIQYVKWFSSLMWLQTTFSLQLLLLLRYPQMKRPLKFMAFRESLAVIVDSEKGNILDLRLESIKRALNLNFWSPLYFAEISDLCGQLDNGQVNPLAKKLDLDCLHPTGWLLWIFAPKMRFSNQFFLSDFSGGLRYMDLKNSKVIQSILENASDGVCTIHADFTPVRSS